MVVTASPTLAWGAAAALALLAGALWWKIFKKAGFRGALGLFMLVPLVNVALLLAFALRRWPIEIELENLRREGRKP